MINSIRNILLPILSHQHPPEYFARPGEIPLTNIALNSLGTASVTAGTPVSNRIAIAGEKARIQNLLNSTERLICQIDPKLIRKDRANGSINPLYRLICDIYFIFRKKLVNPIFRDLLIGFRQDCIQSLNSLNSRATDARRTERLLPPQAYVSTARALPLEEVTVSPLTMAPTRPLSILVDNLTDSEDSYPSPGSKSPEFSTVSEEEMATPFTTQRDSGRSETSPALTPPIPMIMGLAPNT